VPKVLGYSCRAEKPFSYFQLVATAVSGADSAQSLPSYAN